MPQTGTLLLPYPAATDPVSAGAANFQALAFKVEEYLTGWYYEKVGNEQIVPAGAWTDFATILEATVLWAGTYQVEFGGFFDGGGANNGKLGLAINGVNPPTTEPPSGAASPRTLFTGGGNVARSCVLTLAANDKVRMKGWDDRVASRQGTWAKRYMHLRRINYVASRIE